MVRVYTEEQKERKREYEKIYRQQNKEQLAEREKKWRQENKEHVHEIRTKYRKSPNGKKFITMGHWREIGVKDVNDEMYNRYITTTHCDVCNKEFKNSKDRCLDHDHETGEFRQILCNRCNTHDFWKTYFT